MKISKRFKIPTFRLKLFKLKRPFLLVTKILYAKHFFPIKINAQNK